MKLKKLCKDFYWMFVIISFAELFIIGYCHFDRIRNIVTKMFLDSKGNFNWTAVTALAAIFTIALTWINNNKNIKVNLVSKSRIEWIQDVRKTSIEFFNSCYNVISLIDEIKIGEAEQLERKPGIIASAKITIDVKTQQKAEIYGEYEKKVIEEQSNVKKFGDLLTLYLGPDDSSNNDFIVFLIDFIVIQIYNDTKIFEGTLITANDIIQDLKNIFRIYLKIEWKRSIGKINDENVNKELEKDEDYKNIKEKYKIPFENRNNKENDNLEYELIDDKYVECKSQTSH